MVSTPHLYNLSILLQTVEDASVRFYKEMKRHYYTTPSSYLELLKLYQSLLKLKTQEIIAKRKRIASGLNKLLETNVVVCTETEI